MSIKLTPGMCTRLHEGPPDDPTIWESKPTLQFLSIKRVGPPGAERTDRYRIIISDGTHFLQAMLATQLNELVENGTIAKNSIVTIEKMICNFISGKRLVVILGVKVEAKTAEKIGEPAALTPPNNVSEAAPAASAKPTTSTSIPTPTSTSASTSKAPAQPSAQQRRSGKNESLYPIEALSPYQNNWTIKALVTQKSEMRFYSNSRGEGKLFSVTFMDDSGTIKGTAFNVAAEDLYDKLQEGKVYYISKARVDLSKMKFGNTNQYELGLNVNTEIEEVTDVAQVPVIKYNFVKLQDLSNVEKDSSCDVIGIIKAIGDVSQITTKAQKTLTKRELTLVDSSQFSVRLTLWGKQAEQFQGTEQDVVAFKSVKVGDFGGRSLSMTSTSAMELNPDIPEAHTLKGWYIDGGSDTSFRVYNREAGSSNSVNRNEIRTINEVKTSTVDTSEKPAYFYVRATIMSIKNENIAYPACRSENCNKKVVEDPSTSMWRCEKCEKSFDRPEYRYIISMAVADYTDQMWLQGFNDAGEAVLSAPADELVDLRLRDENAFNDRMARAQGKTYNFGVRAKQDTYNESTRVRYGITSVEPVDYTLETRSMLTLLKSPWAN